jgi:hypothetical protein
MKIASLSQSEANQFMLELIALRKEISKDKGLNLFERWVTWLSNCDPVKDPLGYGASADTIFLVIEVLEGLITVEEKKEMGSRILRVIEKNGIEDKDHRDFLERKIRPLLL